MNFIKEVEREIYEWEMMNHYPPLTAEEYFRLGGSLEMRSLRKKALSKQNMILMWFRYGTPIFEEYETITPKKDKT